LILVGALAATGCTKGTGELAIRPLGATLTPGALSAVQRVAEARGQLALGNVALALEGFRKAVREDPTSIDALTGIATCYDQMGRFDLSRQNYETALAIAPSDPQLLRHFAASLELQGLRTEADGVRQEIAALTGKVAATPTPAPTVIATLDSAPPALSEQAVERAPSATITIKLPPAAPAPEVVARTADLEPERTAPQPRLERLSMGEIALVTNPAPLWRAEPVAADAHSTAVRFVPLRSAREPRVRLLNAARINRLAARTRTVLAARGFRTIGIGNAAQVRARSLILHSPMQREFAEQLSVEFGFPRAERNTGSQVTVLLGRDAARLTRS